MKKKLFSVFFIVLALQLITTNIYAYAEPNLLLSKYDSARHIQAAMANKVNWAVKELGKDGDEAFAKIKEFNKTSGVSIFVYDPLNKKMIISPDYVSAVKGSLKVKDINPQFFAEEIIRREIESLTSSSLDKLIEIVKPFDFKNHLGKMALTPSGKVYIVATGLQKYSLAKEFVVGLVKSACNLMKNEGIETAFKEFNRKGSIYRKDNTYLYVFTDKGKYLVNPNLPDIVGKNMYDYAGADNTYPVRKFIEAVSKAPYSSWIYTKSLKPTEDTDAKSRIALDKAGKDLKEKLSFLKKVTIDGQAYIVGSGMYLEDTK